MAPSPEVTEVLGRERLDSNDGGLDVEDSDEH